MTSLPSPSDAQAELLRLGAALSTVAKARKQDQANLQQLEAWMAQLSMKEAPIHAGAANRGPSSFTRGSKQRGGSADIGIARSSTHTNVPMSNVRATANTSVHTMPDVRKLLNNHLHSAWGAQDLAAGLGQLIVHLLFRRVDRANELLFCVVGAGKKQQAQQVVANAIQPVEEAILHATARLEMAEEEAADGSGKGGEADRDQAMKRAVEAAMAIVLGVHNMAEIRAQALSQVL